MRPMRSVVVAGLAESLPHCDVRAGMASVLVASASPIPRCWPSSSVLWQRSIRGGSRRGAPSAHVTIPVDYTGADLHEVARSLRLQRRRPRRGPPGAGLVRGDDGLRRGLRLPRPAGARGCSTGRLVARRDRPRERVPAGSVALAAGMSAVYPEAMPGGWHLLGHTPVRMFDAQRLVVPEPAPPVGRRPLHRGAARERPRDGPVTRDSPPSRTVDASGSPAWGCPSSGAFHRVRYLIATALLSGEPDERRPAIELLGRHAGPGRRRHPQSLAVVGPAALTLDGRRQAGGTVRAGAAGAVVEVAHAGPGPAYVVLDGWEPRAHAGLRGDRHVLAARRRCAAPGRRAARHAHGEPAPRASVRSTGRSPSPTGPIRVADAGHGEPARLRPRHLDGRLGGPVGGPARRRSGPRERLRAQHAAGAGRHPGDPVRRGGRPRARRWTHRRLPGRRGGGDGRPRSPEPAAPGRPRWPSGRSRSTRRRRPDGTSSRPVRRSVAHPDHLP